MSENSSVTSLNSNGRVLWVDVLKFIGIYFIYLGHFAQAAGRFYPFAFAFHVPLFFFVGGFFVSTPGPERNAQAFLSREFRFIRLKAKQLLIPYFVCSLITIGLLLIQYNTGWGPTDLLSVLWEMLLGRREHLVAFPLWFFTCFFVVSVLYRWLLLLFRSPYLLLIPLIALNLWQPDLLAAVHIQPLSLPFNLDSALYYLVFFCAGQCIYPFLSKIWQERKKFRFAIGPVGILLGFLAAGVFFYGGEFVAQMMSRGSLAALVRGAAFIQTILLIFFFVLLAMALSRAEILSRIGAYTLTLCATELITKTLLAQTLQIFNITIPNTLITPLTTVIYTGICCVLGYKIFARWLPAKFPQVAVVFGVKTNTNFKKEQTNERGRI